MAVAVIIAFPDGNAQKYEQVTGKLFPEGKLPEGWQVHIAGPSGNGWQVVNVVPSQEQFETFAREQLLPAARRVGDATQQRSGGSPSRPGPATGTARPADTSATSPATFSAASSHEPASIRQPRR